MEQKIDEENTENNLVFYIDARKASAIKSVPRSVFLNPSHKKNTSIFYFGKSLTFGFFIKLRRNRLCIGTISQERVD